MHAVMCSEVLFPCSLTATGTAAQPAVKTLPTALPRTWASAAQQTPRRSCRHAGTSRAEFHPRRRRDAWSVTCWWHRREKCSALKFLFREENPTLLNVAWRTFLYLSSGNLAWTFLLTKPFIGELYLVFSKSSLELTSTKLSRNMPIVF